MTLTVAGDDPPDLDRYGGWTKYRGEATGFFHVEQVEGRWWFITPDGNVFLSLGVNQVHPVQSVDTTSAGEQPAVDRVRAQNMDHRLEEWGFNTIGMRSAWEARRQGRPFLLAIAAAPVNRARPVVYPDVWDSAFRTGLEDRMALIAGEFRQDPLLIGYTSVDAPAWDIARARARSGTDWVSAIRALGPDAPGKEVYLRFLLERHGSWERVNILYRTHMTEWDQALAAVFPERPAIPLTVFRDDRVFLARIATQYFGVVAEVLRRADPNHLYLGDRFAGGPEEDTPLNVIRAAAPFVDVFAVRKSRSWFPATLLEPFHRLSGKPVLICDGGHVEEPEAYADYHRQAFGRRDWVIGWHFSRLIDQRGPDGSLQPGLLSPDGDPHQSLIAALQTVNRTVYEWAVPGDETNGVHE